MFGREAGAPVTDVTKLNVLALSCDGEMERLDGRLKLSFGRSQSTGKVEEEDAVSVKSVSRMRCMGKSDARRRDGPVRVAIEVVVQDVSCCWDVNTANTEGDSVC